MAVFKSFRAIRPLPGYADKVAALPYDVMNSEEAKAMVEGNPYSFLHVDKAEIDLPENIDIYDEKVYLKARENLDKLQSDGICKQDEKPCFYIYRQIMNGRSQTGLVGCASIDDYMNNIIKKHEFTRADKEADRINHVDYCDANTGPIFLTYREDDFINNSEKTVLVTDDGSKGEKGLVTTALKSLIDAGNEYDCIFVIGPLVMMKFVSLLTKKYGIKTTVSMNPIMVDGTGMCGGCRLTLIKDGKRETRFACVDGPDFNGYEVDFDEAMSRSLMYKEHETKTHEKTCNLLNKGVC